MKFTSPFNLILLINTKKTFKFFSWSNLLEEHHIVSQLVDIIFCLVYTYSFFSCFKPCNTQNGQHTKDSVSQVLRKGRFSISFYLFCKLSNITLEFISELINMNYSFNILFKFSLKSTRELLLNSMIVCSVESFTHL